MRFVKTLLQFSKWVSKLRVQPLTFSLLMFSEAAFRVGEQGTFLLLLPGSCNEKAESILCRLKTTPSLFLFLFWHISHKNVKCYISIKQVITNSS